MERSGSTFEKHTMKQKNLENYQNNKLIKQIINVKELDGEKLFYTIRNNRKECMGVYTVGIATYIELDEEGVLLKPNSMDSLTEKRITTIDMYKEEMKKIISVYKKYQNSTNEMKEKNFQHSLLENINNIETLSKKYGNITIIDEELTIYLTKNKAKNNPTGRVDLVGVTPKGKLIFIEVKIDGSVILGTNGINKHCYDIKQYCEKAKYKKEDLNNWIEQLNKLFDRNIPYIKDANPDFIIICGYNNESKYDVIDQIAAIISSSELEIMKKQNPNNIQVIKDNPDMVKTLKQQFEDIKNNHPLLVLTELKDNKIIIDFGLSIRRINSEKKSWYSIRTGLIKAVANSKK